MKSYLLEPPAQTLPDATDVTIDRKHYYRQVLHGYYQFNCVVSAGVTRSTKFYIPEGSVYNQPTVFIGVPGKENPWSFMVKSGWKALSDEYGLYLVLMEAENEDGWTAGDADVAYLNALNNDLSLRPMFCSFQANFYAIAYGDAADVVGAQSRKAPRAYAAAALIGTKGITAEDEAILKTTPTRVEGVMCAEVQWPIWLTYAEETEDTRRAVAYYRRSNHSSDDASCNGTITTWLPLEGGTPDEHWCANVITDKANWSDCVCREYSEAILNGLFDEIYRYPGTNNGALRRVGNIYDRGFKKYTADIWGGYYADKRDTYHREWYVYVPESAPKGQLLSLVFVFHGAGGSGDEIADRIGWSYVADKYGVMIIMPTASTPDQIREVSDIRTNEIFRAMWNVGYPQPQRPADMLFIDYLYTWVTENYPVDKSRVYASGQSSGGMMSWACASYRPDYFAAVAPFSARNIDIEAATRGEEEAPPVLGSIIPIMANLGRCDSAFKGGFGKGQELVDYWCGRWGLTKTWASYTYDDGGENCSFKEGLFSHYVFENADGVPLLHLTETDTKAHATWPSECEMAYSTYFVKFSKDPDTKELYYEGKLVK